MNRTSHSRVETSQPADDGAGMAGVDRRALGRDDLQHLVEPLVERHVGVDQALQDEDAGGEGLGHVAVHGGPALHVRPREIEHGPTSVQGDAGHEVHRPVRYAVVVQPALGLEGAARQLRKLGPGTLLGVVEDGLGVEPNGVQAVAVEHRCEAAQPQVVGGDLGAQIAGHLLFGAHVGENHLPQAGVDLAPSHELDHREDDSLLVGLAERADAGRRPAAHVHVVAYVGEEPHQLPAVVDGRNEEDVVQVARLAMGVVHHQHVAGREVLGTELADRPRHHPADGDEVGRLAERLGHHPAVRVHERRGIVEAGLDVGGERGALKGHRHLFGHLDEGVADHLEEDGIDAALGVVRLAVRRCGHDTLPARNGGRALSWAVA